MLTSGKKHVECWINYLQEYGLGNQDPDTVAVKIDLLEWLYLLFNILLKHLCVPLSIANDVLQIIDLCLAFAAFEKISIIMLSYICLVAFYSKQ